MKNVALLFGLLLIFSCGSDFKKTPVDGFIQEFAGYETYSIILQDIDMRGTFSKKYFHKYQIIRESDGSMSEETTNWMEVSKENFSANQNNVGMELASKGEDGKVSKVPAPAGFGNYVGNEKYGQWRGSGGSSFWEFYGKFAMMNAVFNMMAGPVDFGSYNGYRRDYRHKQPFYGHNKTRPKYGTSGTVTKNSRPSSFSRRMGNIKSQSKSSFGQRANRIKRSSGRGGSSMRSRSGGFGK